jgi:molybdopterin molybdotransferase/putative molybdopterin biosynthesis protein
MDFDCITRADALTRLFALYEPVLTAEDCPVASALGRILAQDAVSVNTQPVFRASKMDGIAVRSSDFAEGKTPDTAKFVLGTDYIRADTGDDFDDAFDAVVMIEDILFADAEATGENTGGFSFAEGVTIFPGKNVIPKGADLSPGDLLIPAGRRLRSFDLTVLARGGLTAVKVRKRPVVAFIPTGSELVPYGGQLPRRGEIIDSNSVLAGHMLAEMGAEVVTLPIVKDVKAELETALDDALSFADIVVINGGSSKGKDDLNHALLAEKGTLVCHGVLAAPGRPVGVAAIGGKPVINVPGPMVACYYVFDWCLRALIARGLGVAPRRPQTVSAKLLEDLNTPDSLEFLNRLHITKDPAGAFFAAPLKLNREPGHPYILGADNGQFVNEIGVSLYPKNSSIRVELLCDPDELELIKS